MEFVQPIRDLDAIEKMKAVLKRKGTRNYILFVAGINSGLRISDLLSLKVSDVRNKTHISLREEKTGKERRFPINAALRSDLSEYIDGMADNEWLFPSRQGGKAMTRVQSYRILNEAAEQAGIVRREKLADGKKGKIIDGEIGTHTLRKTFGYHMYQRTKDVAMLQKIFGHSAPSITLRYIGIDNDMIDEAYENFSL